MMKHEFEALAGYEVSFEDYSKVIEPMYMATNLSKEDFVKVIDRKRFEVETKEHAEARLKRKMKKLAKHLAETCEHYTDIEAKEELQEAATEYAKLLGYNPMDVNTGFYFESEYTYPQIQRGCTYPKKLVVVVKKDVYEVTLVK